MVSSKCRRLLATFMTIAVMMGTSALVSHVFIGYFNGVSCVSRLFLSEVEPEYIIGLIYVFGLLVSPVVGLLFKSGRLPSVPEAAFFSATHVGILATASAAYEYFWARVYLGGLMLLFIVWYFIAPKAAKLFGKHWEDDAPSPFYVTSLLLLGLMWVTPTTPVANQVHEPILPKEPHYYVAALEYVDEASFEADLAETVANWDGYSEEQRLERLSLVVKYECTNVLGCMAPGIAADDLDPEILGMCLSASREIVIRREHLTDSSFSRVLRTVLHECRHIYQWDCKKMVETLALNSRESLNLDVIRKTTKLCTDALNFDPHDYGSDFEAYLASPTEYDARGYTVMRLENYYGRFLDDWGGSG